jgi:hypothetical protein
LNAEMLKNYNKESSVITAMIVNQNTQDKQSLSDPTVIREAFQVRSGVSLEQEALQGGLPIAIKMGGKPFHSKNKNKMNRSELERL